MQYKLQFHSLGCILINNGTLTKMNFEEAYEYCFNSGGRLIEMHNKQQMDFVNAQLGKHHFTLSWVKFHFINVQLQMAHLITGSGRLTLVMKANGNG